MPINSNLLRAKIIEKGFTQEQLAKMCGISHQSFSYRMNNKIDFRLKEIQIISEVLGIENKDDYFFC